MLGYDDNFKISHIIKKIIILIIFLAAFPLIIPYFGIDVLNDCSTYTISDYEAAKINSEVTLEYESIGKCVKVTVIEPVADDLGTSNLVGHIVPVEGTSGSTQIESGNSGGSGSEKLVGYFKDAYVVYSIILVTLICIIPGYHISRY